MSFEIVFDNGDGIVLDFNHGAWINDYTMLPLEQLIDDVNQLLHGADPIRDKWDCNLGEDDDFNYAEWIAQIYDAPACFTCITDDLIYDYPYWHHEYWGVKEFGLALKDKLEAQGEELNWGE